MRKLVVFLLAGSFLALHSAGHVLSAPNPDTGPGCGPGKKLWADWKGQKQIAPQMFMATTNITGSYSFSISFGTSGCTNDGRIWDSERATLFIGVNYASLAEEMARGGGEHLASLATLLHVPLAYHSDFFAMAQEHYASLIDEGENVPAAIKEAVYETMRSHPVLAQLSMNH